MAELRDQKKILDSAKLISRSVVSLLFVFLTQLSLALISHFFSAYSFLLILPLSVLVLLAVAGTGRFCRRLLRLHVSAPAFVFFSVLFHWGVYLSLLRQEMTLFMELLFNGEVIMLIFGLYSIIASDPGLVTHGSSRLDRTPETDNHEKEMKPLKSSMLHEDPIEGSILNERVRYCQRCKAFVKGFDHHCPAFGNCIGHRNYVLFIVLLIGFMSAEATYFVCLLQFWIHISFLRVVLLVLLIRYICIYEFSVGAKSSSILDSRDSDTCLSRNVVYGTMLFSILQISWQVLFLAWHIYCICFNITTDEWINWKKYSEFQVIVQSQPEESSGETRFQNPYDRGTLQNVKEFLSVKR